MSNLTGLWIGFDGDIFALAEQMRSEGVLIKMEPTNFSWGFDLHLEDPDGHILRFGTDPDPDKPLFMDQ